MNRHVTVALLSIVLTACSGRATFVVANDSKEPIRSAVVEVLGTAVELGQIGPGEKATGEVVVGSDDEYHVTIRFQSGRMLDRLGYVTSGVAIRDQLSVSETDIVLKRVVVK